jgi:hypothetical protein
MVGFVRFFSNVLMNIQVLIINIRKKTPERDDLDELDDGDVTLIGNG